VEVAEGDLDRAEQFYGRALDIKHSVAGFRASCGSVRHFRSGLSIF
jgi:hypothetical protein